MRGFRPKQGARALAAAIALAASTACTPGFNGVADGEYSWAMVDQIAIVESANGTFNAGLCVFSDGTAIAPVISWDTSPEAVLAIRRSTDDGRTWTEVADFPLGTNLLSASHYYGRGCVVDPQDDEAMVLVQGAAAGIFHAIRSLDRGATWTPVGANPSAEVDTGATSVDDYHFAFNDGKLTLAYVSALDGVRVTEITKGGASFGGSQVFDEMNSPYLLRAMGPAPSGDGLVVYAVPAGIATSGAIISIASSGSVSPTAGHFTISGTSHLFNDTDGIVFSSGRVMLLGRRSEVPGLYSGTISGGDVTFGNALISVPRQATMAGVGPGLRAGSGDYVLVTYVHAASGHETNVWMGSGSNPSTLTLGPIFDGAPGRAYFSALRELASGSLLASVTILGELGEGNGHRIYRYGK